MQNASPRDPTVARPRRRRVGLVLGAAAAGGALVAAALAFVGLRVGTPAIAPAPGPEPELANPAATHSVMRPLIGSTEPPAAPVWSVDKTASRLTFRASLGGQPVDGVFKTWDAQIAFDPKNLKASHATIVVETASALTGEPTRDDLLPTSNWLSTRRFPRATLVTRTITQTGAGRYQATADLKVRGVTTRVVAPFTLSIIRDVGRMQAMITVDRNAYAVGEVPGLTLSALAPEVQLRLRLVARKDR